MKRIKKRIKFINFFCDYDILLEVSELQNLNLSYFLFFLMSSLDIQLKCYLKYSVKNFIYDSLNDYKCAIYFWPLSIFILQHVSI